MHLQYEPTPVKGTDADRSTKLNMFLISRGCLHSVEGVSHGSQYGVGAMTWGESKEERAQGMQGGGRKEAAFKQFI